jgi:hypothetical protein
MAAGATYVSIASNTLTGAASSVTFSSISGAYTDLVLVFEGLASATAANGFQIKINGASGTLQSYTRLQGNGTTASSGQVTNGDPACGVIGNTNRSNITAHIMNYSNATTYKTILSRYNSLDSSDGRTGAYVNLTRATTAVTSLLIDLGTANNFASGSTFSLYGIAAA